MIDLEQVLPSSEHELFHRARLEYPDRAIRIRDDRAECELPFRTEPIAWHPQGRWLCGSEVRPASFLNYGAADYYIQDAGSLLPIALLDPQPGEWILDLCAAPGGKASAILEAMQGRGLLVANEAIKGRLDSLKYMLARTGHANYLVSHQDPEDMSEPLSGLFDAVLVDAPCSGQMLVARDKRDENAWSQKQVLHSAKRQNRILDAALRMLKPGGRLVYSTCTFAIEEDEEQISRLLQLHAASLHPLEKESLSAWNSPMGRGCYRLWPHRDRCAGGFAGGIVLGEIEPEWDENVGGKSARFAKGKGLRGHPKEEKEVLSEVSGLGEVSRDLQYRLWGGELALATPDAWQLLDRYHWLGSPMTAAFRKGERWLPSHALALLRPAGFEPTRWIDADGDFATRYLRGEVVPFDRSDYASGWHVARWRNSPLGWVKSAGNRWNNHLPAWAVMNSIADPS